MGPVKFFSVRAYALGFGFIKLKRMFSMY